MKAAKKARPVHRKTAHRLNGALFVVICPHRPERPDNGIRRLPGHGPFAPAPPERRKEETGPPSYRSVPLRGSGCPALWDCIFPGESVRGPVPVHKTAPVPAGKAQTLLGLNVYKPTFLPPGSSQRNGADGCGPPYPKNDR